MAAVQVAQCQWNGRDIGLWLGHWKEAQGGSYLRGFAKDIDIIRRWQARCWRGERAAVSASGGSACAPMQC